MTWISKIKKYKRLDKRERKVTPQILYTLLLRKRLIPPKRSHQSFLKLKKIGVSHQNRAIKKLLQN